jgi:glycosyltransferase involved in cell wall biosynthesis
MPRALHLIDTGGPGGAETIFLELVRGLGHHGWESVAVVPEEDWLAGALRDCGIEPVHVASTGAFDVAYARRLRKLMRETRVDLVQTHLFGTSVYATLASAGTGLPVVSTLHGHPDIPTRGRLVGAKVRLLGGRRNRVVCVSASLRDHFRASGKLPARMDVEVIPNGVDLRAVAGGQRAQVRRELGIDDRTPLIGAVGNVRPSKAYPVLLRAFARVRASVPDAHLAIAGQGSGPPYDHLIALQTELRLNGACHFLGFRDDVASVLAALDVFTLSSSDEGFSLAMVQAMARGLPVVATRCGGPDEIAGDSGAAILVPTDDPDALASEIVRVLGSPNLAARIGAAARSRVQERYSVTRMLADYAALYDRCLAR